MSEGGLEGEKNAKNKEALVWYNALYKVNCYTNMRCKPEPQRRPLTFAKTGNPTTKIADRSVVE